MNKNLFFIWSICLLAIVLLLAGCDKDDEPEDLIVVKSFEGTDGMEGERILFELEETPAVILQNDSYKECVLIGLEETWNHSYHIPPLIGISKDKLNIEDFPPQTEIQVSLLITNVERNVEANIFPMDLSLNPIRKAYLKDIRIRK